MIVDLSNVSSTPPPIDLKGVLEEIEAIQKDTQIIAKDGENIPQKWTPEPITPDMLPPSIRGWVNDVCERIESPFEIGAVSALCFIGNLIGSKVGVRPKAKDNWTVVPNLWGMVIGKASVKKSPVYNELFRSIKRIQTNAFSEFESDKQKVFEEYQRIDAKIKEIEKTKAPDMDAIIALKNSKPSMPKLRRYTTQDATIEAITKILQDNPNGVLNTRDELMGFLKSMDKNGHESDRAFYLEGWNGTGGHIVDRAGAGVTNLPRLTLGVLGSIQPSMIKNYVYEAVKDKKADGFLQRFQLAIFAEPMEQTYIDRYPNATARNEFDKIVDYIATNDEFEGTQKDDFGEIPFYRFNDEAQKIFIDWYLSNTKEATDAGNEALSAHLSKYDKLFTSLALIFHICDIAEGRSFDYTKIDKRNTERALSLTNALKSHAYKLYSTFEIEEEKRDATTDKIMLYLAGKLLPVTFRDVTLKAGGKPTKSETERAIKGHYSFSGSMIVKRLF